MGAKLSQADLDDFEQLFVAGSATHYSAHVVRLIRKADFENKMLLSTIYPDHVAANTLFDLAPLGSRLWRCEECDHLAYRPPAEVHPGRCQYCGMATEPALPPDREKPGARSQTSTALSPGQPEGQEETTNHV